MRIGGNLRLEILQLGRGQSCMDLSHATFHFWNELVIGIDARGMQFEEGLQGIVSGEVFASECVHCEQKAEEQVWKALSKVSTSSCF